MPYSRLRLRQSSMPAILAIAYGRLVSSSGPVSRYSSLSGCGASARVDAGAAQEDEAPHAAAEGRVDDVELDRQVVGDELVGVLPVGEDAAHSRRGDDDGLRLLALKKRAGGRAVCEVDAVDAAQDEVLVARRTQAPQDGAADESGVAGKKNAFRSERMVGTCRHDAPYFTTAAVAPLPSMLSGSLCGLRR